MCFFIPLDDSGGQSKAVGNLLAALPLCAGNLCVSANLNHKNYIMLRNFVNPPMGILQLTNITFFYIADDSEIADSSFNDWQKSTAHTDGTLSKITDPNERKRAEELIDILHVSPETMTYRQQNTIILNLAASLTLDARNKVIEFLEILNKVPEYVKEDSEEIYD